MQRKTLKVLLIEDSPEYAELVQTWLSPSAEIEFALNWADSLAAGLKRLQQGGVDVILLDLGLPDDSGHNVLKKLREWFVNPVIILSVQSSEEDIVKALDNGADDYLVKPFRTG